ncbi:MAG: hypothetical protein ACRC8C_00805 [Mycoplasmoidaceae bacterium]
MDTRKAIYNFILDSTEYQKYKDRKKIVSISSSIIFLIGCIILFFMMSPSLNNDNFLIAGIVIIVCNTLYILISIQIFLKILKKNIYKQINNDIDKWIKKENNNIKINDEEIKELKITTKIKNYNYRQTILSLMSDDISDKIKELIKNL